MNLPDEIAADLFKLLVTITNKQFKFIEEITKPYGGPSEDEMRKFYPEKDRAA